MGEMIFKETLHSPKNKKEKKRHSICWRNMYNWQAWLERVHEIYKDVRMSELVLLLKP